MDEIVGRHSGFHRRHHAVMGNDRCGLHALAGHGCVRLTKRQLEGLIVEPFVSAAHAQDVDWQKVDETLGRKPAVSGDVHRYGFPRSDLKVTLDGVTIKPAWRSAAGSRSSRCMAASWRWATSCCWRPRSIP